MKTKFLTRKQGTPKQIGQVFPTPYTRKHAKIKYRRPTQLESQKLSDLELRAAREERKLLDANFKGWLIAVKYKDGSTEEIPIIAKDYQSALDKAKPKMNQVASQIDEIVIIDPKLGEILHKIGTGAMVVAKKIGRGVKTVIEKAPEKIEKAGIKTARELGRIAAWPAEMREAYEAAKAERPWLKPEQFAKEQGVHVRTIEEWHKEPTPAVYSPKRISMPTEEYMPSERAELVRQTIIARQARAVQRPKLNGRALRPFGIPMRQYQLRTVELAAHEEPSRIELARRKAAWSERAPVEFV